MLANMSVSTQRKPVHAHPEALVTGPVRVLVVHPSELVRIGLVELLRADHVCEIPSGVGSVYEAYRVAAALPTRVVIFEYGQRGGTDAARLLASISPRPKLVALVPDAGQVSPAQPLAAGVDGVVAMDGAGRDAFTAAIRSVLAGNVGVIAGFPAGARTPRAVPVEAAHGLTARERELLYLIGEGLTNREIAELLTLSVKTVETHRSNLSRKLGLRSRAGLMRLAMGAGMGAGFGGLAMAPMRPAWRTDA